MTKNLDQKERKAVTRIKSNPKYLYSYAKSLPKVKSTISMIIDDSSTVITDTKTIADNFLEQFFFSIQQSEFA